MSMFKANPNHPMALLFLDAIDSTLTTGLCSYLTHRRHSEYGLSCNLCEKARTFLDAEIDQMYADKCAKVPVANQILPKLQYLDYPVEAYLYEHAGRQATSMYHSCEYKMDPSTEAGRLRRWWAYNLAAAAERAYPELLTQ